MKQVVITGSVAFDHIMNMPGRFKDHIMPDKIHMLNVSFNVDKLRKEHGGTGSNQAYSLALLGLKPKLVAAVGRDFGEYRQRLNDCGVDTGEVKCFADDLTANGFVVADQDGNQVWTFYGGAMKKARELSLSKYFDKNCFVIIAPNDPKAMIKYVNECSKAKIDYLYDPAFWIVDLDKEELVKGVVNGKILVGNDYEMTLLLKKTGLTKKQVLTNGKVLITTLGAKGSWIETKDKKYRIPAAKPKNTSDPTGAGDAYRSGFVAGYLKSLPLPVCGRMGALAAAYTVEKYGTQTHKFTLQSFEARYKKNFGKELSL